MCARWINKDRVLNIIFSLFHVVTVYSVDLSCLLLMMNPMMSSNITATAEPAAHHRTKDESEAEEKQRKSNILGF